MKTSDLYIGIDLGTSNLKALLVSADGEIEASASMGYSVSYPRDGWSEQNPEDWYAAALSCMERVLRDADKRRVKGLSVGGQMHGLVALDAEGKVIRPCILWNDGRTDGETEFLNGRIGREKLASLTGNIAFAGFTAPKLLWLRDNEPHSFARTAHILLPKDYLLYRLTGEFSTDCSDASGTLLLDVKNRRWSEEMLQICGIDRAWLPALSESFGEIGVLRRDTAERLGLGRVTVAAGAGDNAAAAVGVGAVGGGGCNISLGTSGTLFVSSESYREDKSNALHAFCHADGGYHLMGCVLSAASCNAWWCDKVLRVSDYGKEQRELNDLVGRNDVFFLPYLMGERSPHNDVNARGAFVGMRPDTDRRHMTLAVMEGVAFALKDCLKAAEADGVVIGSTKICGGGAKSALWRRITADVLGIPVETPVTEQGPAFGAALLAMTCCGEYADVRQAASATVKIKSVTEPSSAAALYEKKYGVYAALYPALKNVFASVRESASP